MKRKKFNKKLALNKKTVADLSSGEMKDLKGGESALQCTVAPNDCDTWPILECYSIKNC